MEKTRRLGRPRARADAAARRRRATQVLQALIEVCRRLGRMQPDAAGKRACAEVERALRRLAPKARRRGKGGR